MRSHASHPTDVPPPAPGEDDAALAPGEEADGAGQPATRRRRFARPRIRNSVPLWVATILLFTISWAAEPQSLSHSSLQGMLPFAGILAIVAVGQTLVIQQGGIDLSVPGVISVTVIICTVIPNGDSGKLGIAVVIAYGAALAAGLLSGFCVSVIGITPSSPRWA